jgi:hypothetical protein
VAAFQLDYRNISNCVSLKCTGVWIYVVEEYKECELFLKFCKKGIKWHNYIQVEALGFCALMDVTAESLTIVLLN